MPFDYGLRADVRRAAGALLVGLILLLIAFSFMGLGCTAWPGLRKSAEEPIHAESGIGLTVGKVPVAGIGTWGFGLFGGGSVPQVVIHQYSYQAQPAPTPPGAPPAPPIAPAPPSHPTVYASAWDDPTLVVLNNQSPRFVRVSIDSQPEFRLSPYQATTDLHLGLGEHRVKIVVEKPTAAHGTLEVQREFRIGIRPEGRSQIISIYDW